MRDWYCYIDGRRYGPVGEDVLRQWAAEGRVKPTDQVWTDGMANWAAAGLVEGFFAPGVAGPPPFNALLSCPPPGGTQGQTPNADLTAQARGLLRGKWGLPIGFSLLLGLLAMAAGLVPYVGGVASLILAGAFELGGVVFYITFVRGGNCELGMLFAGFKVFGKALGAYLLRALFILLWMLPAYAVLIAGAIGMVAMAHRGDEAMMVVLVAVLGVGFMVLMIPAIIAGLSYSQTFYLLADDPLLGPLEAIRRSKEIMRGHRVKLYCLWLRFFGWGLLCLLAGVITCGLGLIAGSLFLAPYMAAACARFYDDLKPPAAVATAGQLTGPPSRPADI